MNEIGRKVANGEYKVDPAKVAEEMLERARIIRRTKRALIGDEQGRAAVKRPARRRAPVKRAGRAPKRVMGAGLRRAA